VLLELELELEVAVGGAGVVLLELELEVAVGGAGVVLLELELELEDLRVDGAGVVLLELELELEVAVGGVGVVLLELELELEVAVGGAGVVLLELELELEVVVGGSPWTHAWNCCRYVVYSALGGIGAYFAGCSPQSKGMTSLCMLLSRSESSAHPLPPMALPSRKLQKLICMSTNKGIRPTITMEMMKSNALWPCMKKFLQPRKMSSRVHLQNMINPKRSRAHIGQNEGGFMGKTFMEACNPPVVRMKRPMRHRRIWSPLMRRKLRYSARESL